MANIGNFPINIDRGFWPSAGLVGPTRVPNSIRDGLNMIYLAPGEIRSAKGLGTSQTPGGQRLYLFNNQIAAVQGKGSVFPYEEVAPFYVSDGPVLVNGTTVGNNTSGLLYFQHNGTTYKAGLAAPPAPTVAASMAANVNRDMMGDYSIMVTRKRSFSTGESNGSDRSAVVSVKGNKVTVTFNGAPTLGQPDYHDNWGVYVTIAGEATIGPWTFLQDVPTGTASIDLEWDASDNDNDLEPPTDHDVPPVAEFAISLGLEIVLLNTQGGTFVNPSVPGDGESYPAVYSIQLDPPEKVIGFARANEGTYWVWTANSVQAITYTGSASQPVIVRCIFGHSGVQSPHGACFGANEFVWFNSKSGLMMMDINGVPTATFALPVRDYIRQQNWDASKVVVGYDGVNDAYVVAYGTKALAYMRSQGIWSPPIELNMNGTAPVISAITLGGQLYLCDTTNGLWTWEGGAASYQNKPYYVPAWQDANAPSDRKTVIGWRTSCNASGMVTKLFLDYADTNGTATETFTDAATGQHVTKWKRCNRHCRVYTVRHELQHQDESIYNTDTRAIYESGLREPY